MRVRLHAFESASRANGPGVRAVVWFQGCTLGCPGCFNPATHDPNGGYLTNTVGIAKQILRNGIHNEGVSISGGEPFQQPEALLDLLHRVKNSGLSVLVFTGYTLGEAQRQTLGAAILGHVDVLVAGRYVLSEPTGLGLLGSTNQRIHLLTARYRHTDFASIPATEVIIHRDGTVTITGIRDFQP